MRLKIFTSMLLLGALLTPVASHAGEEGGLQLAVMPLSGGPGLPADVRSNLDLFADAIRSVAVSAHYQVMTKENIFAILHDKGINPNACAGAQCVVSYGRALQADKLVVGNIKYIQGIYYLDLELYDVPTGFETNSKQPECKGCGFDKLLQLVRQTSLELFGLTAVPASPAAENNNGALLIDVQPVGTRILIDGMLQGVSEEGKPVLIQNLLPGMHRVVAQRQDYQSREQDIDITRNVQSRISIVLSPEPGKLTVSTGPVRADVILDGRKVGETPYTGDAAPGTHSVKVTARGYKSQEKQITVQANRPVAVSFVFKSVRMTIDGMPAGSGVYVNDDYVGSLPYAGKIGIGGNVIEVRRSGYYSWEKSVSVTEGKEVDISGISLQPRPASLSVQTVPPDARVYINGRYYGTTPLSNISLNPSSTYTISLEKNEYESVSTGVSTRPGGSYDVTRELNHISEHEIYGGFWIPVTQNTIPAGAGVEYDGKPWGTSGVQLNPVVGLHVGAGFWYGWGNGDVAPKASLVIVYVPIEADLPNDNYSPYINVYAALEPYYYDGTVDGKKSVSGMSVMGEAGIKVIGVFKIGYMLENEVGGVLLSAGWRF